MTSANDGGVNNELKGYQFLLRRIFADYRQANQHEIIKGLSKRDKLD